MTLKKTKLVAAASAALIAGLAAAPACAAPAGCGPVPAVTFITDVSGSMMETFGDARARAGIDADRQETDGRTRADLARELIGRLGAAAAEGTNATTGLLTLSPFTELMPDAKRPADDFGRELEARLPVRLEVFGRPSRIGERALKRLSAPLGDDRAVIFITDGGFETEPEDGRPSAVAALEAFVRANPQVCPRIVSAAVTEAERAGVEALARVAPCAPVADLETLVRDEKAFEAFRTETLSRPCATLEIEGVTFAFESARLEPAAVETLGRALEAIARRDASERILIRGWTDHTGGERYNRELSLRRARAVRDHFAAAGVDPARLSVEGAGKSFKYDNATRDGRRRNRRVELIFENGMTSKDAL